MGSKVKPLLELSTLGRHMSLILDTSGDLIPDRRVAEAVATRFAPLGLPVEVCGLGHMTLDAGGKDTFLRPVSSTV